MDNSPQQNNNLPPNSSPEKNTSLEDSNWIDDDANSPSYGQVQKFSKKSPQKLSSTLVVVETAFLASTASLIWLIDYYFPLGPLLRIFFPIPIALVYLRWGHRASWMSALVSGLLLSVLMGPTRSIVFLMPFGLMGVQLGACWRRKIGWGVSIFLGGLLSTFGFFFRLWLFSILLGEDIWLYLINQITNFLEWVFLKLDILAQPNFIIVQIVAIALLFVNSLVYLFSVHLVALLVLPRLGNPIPSPPEWIQVILDYE